VLIVQQIFILYSVRPTTVASVLEWSTYVISQKPIFDVGDTYRVITQHWPMCTAALGLAAADAEICDGCS